MPGRNTGRCWVESSVVSLFLASLPVTVHAQGFLEFLDSIDLNEYSLGLNYYFSQSRYDGVDPFMVIYPAPTSYAHPTMTTDTFFLEDGNIGLRRVDDNGWTFGGFIKIQALGYGSNESEVLVGMRRRDWTLQPGAMLGTKLGPVHVDLFASADALNEHNGHDATLKLAWPLVGTNAYIVPQLDLTYLSADLVNHYYGVRPDEVLPGRPAYVPGSATTLSAGVDAAWHFHPDWYLGIDVAVDFLPDEIRRSPLVGADSRWRANISLAYDRASFVEPGVAGLGRSRVELGVSAFFIDAESNMDFAGTPPADNLESGQALEETATTLPIDFVWQAGRFHRVDLGYFELTRSGSIELQAPLTVGTATFQTGETVVTDFDTRVFRFGYGFAFLRDKQKDLSVFGGMHVSDIDYRVRGANESITASTTALLPVVGIRFRVTPAERWSALVNFELFALDFDRHSGELYDLSLAGRYRLTEKLSVGLGYRYYRQDIDSGDDSFLGDYRLTYRGPALSLLATF